MGSGLRLIAHLGQSHELLAPAVAAEASGWVPIRNIGNGRAFD